MSYALSRWLQVRNCYPDHRHTEGGSIRLGGSR